MRNRKLRRHKDQKQQNERKMELSGNPGSSGLYMEDLKEAKKTKRIWTSFSTPKCECYHYDRGSSHEMIIAK
jgi:hypothetical protein